MKNTKTPHADKNLYAVRTHAAGPAGRLPFQADWLRDTASGNVFGWTQDAAMGWSPDQLGKPEFLILSTQGGIRAPDGTPIALGYHTGHWEVGLLAQAVGDRPVVRGHELADHDLGGAGMLCQGGGQGGRREAPERCGSGREGGHGPRRIPASRACDQRS